MKICLTISVVLIIFSCVSIAQTNSNDTDPFLGHYTLGGRGGAMTFASSGSGCVVAGSDSISYSPGVYSDRGANLHVVPQFTTSTVDTIISVDGVSGNFLMGSTSDQQQDEVVWGVIESVGDSMTYVSLYVQQDGFTDAVRYPIDSLKKQSNASINRVEIRMTSGYFDGGPAKEFAVAYNLPDSSQKISLRLFKLDGTTGLPDQITSTQEDTLPTNLAAQALFDITAGDYNGDGKDEIMLVKNTAKMSSGLVDYALLLNFHVYDFDVMNKNLISKGNYTWGWNWGGWGDNTLAQLTLSSGDFNGDGRAECAFGLVVAPYWSYNLYYQFQTVSVSPDLMTFTFTTGHGMYNIEHKRPYNVNVWPVSATLSLAAGDLNKNGKDELVCAAYDSMYIYKFSSTFFPTKVSQFPCFSRKNDPSRHTVAIEDVDGDTTFTNSADSHWYPEIITLEWANNPTTQTSSQGNFFINKVYTLTDTSKFTYTSEQCTNIDNPWFINSLVIGEAGIVPAYFKNKITMGKPKLQVVKNLVEPVVILNAPPVGFDVIGDSAYNLCDAYPISPANSSSDPFSSQLVQINSTEADLTTETHSSWGVSSTLSAGGDFFGIGVKTSFTAQYGQDFNKTQSNSSTFTVTYSKEAQWDDFIYATVTDYDIWEYPVYADGAMKGHVIAAIARPQISAGFYNNDETGFGNNIILDHEPGNLLSYPEYSNPAQNPDVDSVIYLGALTSIGASNSPGFLKLDFSTINTSKVEKSVNYGFSAKASVEGWGVSLETEGNYNRGAVNTHTTTISQSFDLTANAGSINSLYSNADYTITPYVYWSKEGALVLDYMVGFPSGAAFWKEHYSQYPDLTFNCYYRYFGQKGLGGLSPETADWTKEIQIFPSTPKEGDTVTVLAEIHNYSLKATSSQVQVRFYLGNSESGGMPVLDLNGDSVFTTSSPVAARGDQIINFKWKVPNGLVSSDSIIYAVIDPYNKITELKDDNNVGWNNISIMNVTSVSPVKSDQISSYILSQNYPNPFNPVTRINYQIPKLSHVTIKIYNILGQEIATLVNEEKMTGHYSVEFNASNFASGIYFYRMQAGDFVSTKKLILLK